MFLDFEITVLHSKFNDRLNHITTEFQKLFVFPLPKLLLRGYWSIIQGPAFWLLLNQATAIAFAVTTPFDIPYPINYLAFCFLQLW